MRDAIVVLGERARVAAFALAGSRVLVAETADELRRQWGSIGDDVAVVVLTAAAATVLADERAAPDMLRVVMP